jgi:hypothetical protein
MNRRDLIENEQHQARTYRREAKRRRAKYPELADQLDRFAEASEMRVETFRSGPLWDRGQ